MQRVPVESLRRTEVLVAGRAAAALFLSSWGRRGRRRLPSLLSVEDFEVVLRLHLPQLLRGLAQGLHKLLAVGVQLVQRVQLVVNFLLLIQGLFIGAWLG